MRGGKYEFGDLVMSRSMGKGVVIEDGHDTQGRWRVWVTFSNGLRESLNPSEVELISRPGGQRLEAVDRYELKVGDVYYRKFVRSGLDIFNAIQPGTYRLVPADETAPSVGELAAKLRRKADALGETIKERERGTVALKDRQDALYFTADTLENEED